MGHLIAKYALLIIAGAPFVYYFLSLFQFMALFPFP